MDRRQQKTKAAIYQAFSTLLSKESYNKITVQEIIDEANIGRTTFYAHFNAKDELLKSMCEDLFKHVINNELYLKHEQNIHVQSSVFCHLLKHLQQDHNLLTLLSSENNEIFLRYFKNLLNDLMKNQFITNNPNFHAKLPEDFLINHISGSFVEMVTWWINNGLKATPEELDQYFHQVIDPIL